VYPNSSDNPSARGQELVPFKPQDDVLEGVIVDGHRGADFGFRFTPPPRPVFEPPVFTPPTAEEIRQAFAPVRRGLNLWATFIDEAASAFRRFGEAAREAGFVPEEAPTDPRARALWMKQHRNTGPATPKDWRKR